MDALPRDSSIVQQSQNGCKEMTWLKLETAAGFQQAEAYLVPDDMKNYRLG